MSWSLEGQVGSSAVVGTIQNAQVNTYPFWCQFNNGFPGADDFYATLTAYTTLSRIVIRSEQPIAFKFQPLPHGSSLAGEVEVKSAAFFLEYYDDGPSKFEP